MTRLVEARDRVPAGIAVLVISIGSVLLGSQPQRQRAGRAPAGERGGMLLNRIGPSSSEL